MVKKRPIKWRENGDVVEYESVSEMARLKGVARPTIYTWLKKGYASDDDIETVGRPRIHEPKKTKVKRGNPRKVTFRGKTYPSVTVAAKANDVSRQTVYNELAKSSD